MDTYHNYIDGQWAPAKSGRTFVRENPATGEPLATFPNSDRDDVAAAAEAAVRALAKWKATPAPKRGEILFRAGRMLIERKEELARDIVLEMGKVLPEARGDVQEGIDM